MRSSWKLAPIESVFLRSTELNVGNNRNALKFWAKGTRIFSDLLEKNLQVYTGMKFVDVLVRKEMWGRQIGNFVLCKRITADIHSKTRKNKKGRMKKKKK